MDKCNVRSCCRLSCRGAGIYAAERLATDGRCNSCTLHCRHIRCVPWISDRGCYFFPFWQKQDGGVQICVLQGHTHKQPYHYYGTPVSVDTSTKKHFFQRPFCSAPNAPLGVRHMRPFDCVFDLVRVQTCSVAERSTGELLDKFACLWQNYVLDSPIDILKRTKVQTE